MYTSFAGFLYPPVEHLIPAETSFWSSVNMVSNFNAILLFLKGKYSQIHGWGLVYAFCRGSEIAMCSAKELSMTADPIILMLSFKLLLSLSEFPFYLSASNYTSAEALLRNDLQTL